MRKILYITYHFPPMNGSTSVMNFQVVNHLGEDFKIHVLTIKENKYEQGNSLINRLKNNVEVMRTEVGFLHKKYYSYKRPGYSSGKPKLKTMKRRFREIISDIKKTFLIPDSVIDWYPVALSYIKSRIKEIKPELIISSATPYTSHLIGYQLSKEYNIPLMLFYGDPWVYEQSRKRGFLRFNLEKMIERLILKQAVKVFTVTETTRELYISKYQLSPKKIDFIQSGFDPKDFHYGKFPKNGRLTMIYGGALNPVHRNPQPFFDAIIMLDEKVREDICFKLYCDETVKYKEIVESKGLEKTVVVEDLVPYEEFTKQLESSDLLILFGNSSSLQVAGKVYDYIGSLTKILLINNTENYVKDPTFKILNSYDGNFHAINNSTEIRNILVKIHKTWKDNCLEKNNFSDVHKFTWNNSISKMSESIEDYLSI